MLRWHAWIIPFHLQLMLDTWNESIFSNIKNRLQDSAMKLVHAERLGEAFDSQLVIGVRESYGEKLPLRYIDLYSVKVSQSLQLQAADVCSCVNQYQTNFNSCTFLMFVLPVLWWHCVFSLSSEPVFQSWRQAADLQRQLWEGLHGFDWEVLQNTGAGLPAAEWSPELHEICELRNKVKSYHWDFEQLPRLVSVGRLKTDFDWLIFQPQVTENKCYATINQQG